MAGEFAEAAVETEVDPPRPGPVLVVSDEGQLRQALVNVLRNASRRCRRAGASPSRSGRTGIAPRCP